MARTAKTTKTEPVAEAAIVEEPAVAAVNAAEENMCAETTDAAEENINKETEVVKEKKSSTRQKKTQTVKTEEVVEEPLDDSDEIEVMSLIPKVAYEDNRTSDYYQWENVGQIEMMTFDAIKAMHRKYKSYFGDMWLKPLDERVIKKLGLTRTYEKYDFLMDETNYTAEHIDEVLDGISSASAGLKIATVNRIKNMVSDGTVSDVKVIKKLENRLDIDLISFL